MEIIANFRAEGKICHYPSHLRRRAAMPSSPVDKSVITAIITASYEHGTSPAESITSLVQGSRGTAKIET
jgi:hypothetical protein